MLESAHDTHHHDVNANTIFGFWLYLMTDFILFATLFATYAVLHGNTYGGPGSRDLFSPSYALAETLVLLFSSLTCALAMLAVPKQDKTKILAWFSLTFLLGVVFLVMVGSEFSDLIAQGNSWRRSAFLSSYFTLIGVHALHIAVGLVFMIFFNVQMWRRGFFPALLRRLTCLKLFWFFSYFVWIFMFTIVYLMGVA